MTSEKTKILSDHDLLIRLDAKVDGLTTTTKDLASDLVQRVSKNEQRLDLFEREMAESRGKYNPEYRLRQIDELWSWRHDFDFRWKFIIAGATFIGAVVGFCADLVIRYLLG